MFEHSIDHELNCLDYRDHCYLFRSETLNDVIFRLTTCSPSIVWFTLIAFIHFGWISALCGTLLYQVNSTSVVAKRTNLFLLSLQIATGYTTNEMMNSWRYTHLRSRHSSPFSLGFVQNLMDLLGWKMFICQPIRVDWSATYSLEEFEQTVSRQLRRRTAHLAQPRSNKKLTDV
jgi:hypothetical protein